MSTETTGQSDQKLLSGRFQRIGVFLAIALLGLGHILSTLPEIASPLSDRTCITGSWKLALILTHILIFVLIPIAMNVFYRTLTVLQASNSAIFASQLGLSLIMVSVASEMGAHVTQCWYYENEFTMLNFMFYFFLLSAFALWGDGLAVSNTRGNRLLNLIFALSLLVVSILYPLGDITANSSYKIPIYIALTLNFTVLVYRGYKLLGDDLRVLLFPFFSVGVNLFFVFLLQAYGGDPYTDPNVSLNALFHILHDLIGTEAGIAIFTVLVYLKGREAAAGSLN
ncbi:hypothetical protein [Vacuolonema iberomarrocanum]|uniref:hypothetical protein n=1 Tax=Vacuolonema iberomarrocanum TaxID=3454632 RepID=UPI0019F19D92|nr:hypothetical protein [filamentous cyanobacterium LEGE 07170]